MAPWAIFSSIFIARSTGEGSRLPLLHAAPALAQIPFSLSKSRIASASRRANAMLVVVSNATWGGGGVGTNAKPDGVVVES